MVPSPPHKPSRLDWVLLALSLAVVIGAYGFIRLFERHTYGALYWLQASWNPESGYEHGWGIFPVVLALLWKNRERIRTLAASSESAPKGVGMIWVIFGILLFLVSARTLQPRIAIAGLPFLFYGMVYWIWGKHVARRCIFPFAMIFFAIPVPGFSQATNGLQIVVTKAAAKLANFCGVETIVLGNKLNLAQNGIQMGDFEVDEGCSGIRSLTALTLIAFVYAYYRYSDHYRRGIVFLAAIPIAILTNAIRIWSILMVAKYYDPKFAQGAYHDYSGFVSFGIALGLLLLLSHILSYGFKFRRKSKVVVTKSASGKPTLAATTDATP